MTKEEIKAVQIDNWTRNRGDKGEPKSLDELYCMIDLDACRTITRRQKDFHDKTIEERLEDERNGKVLLFT